MVHKEVGRILCVGVTPCLQRTIRFANFELGEVNRASSVVLSSGGKASNVARGLKALQVRPFVVGFAGGETGKVMISFLQNIGVETDFIWTTQATRICTTLIDDKTACVTELVEEAPSPTPDEWAVLDEKISLLLAHSDIMVLAGAPPPDSPVDVYARLARKARESGVAVLVDARGQVLTAALPYAPLLVKLNAHELAATCGGAVDVEKALRNAMQVLIAGGARWCLVTRGRGDAWLLNEATTWRYTPAQVDVLNTVGSGDATTAGIAAGLLGGESMPDAVRYGIACGSASAMTLTPGDLDASQVREFLPTVRIVEGGIEPV